MQRRSALFKIIGGVVAVVLVASVVWFFAGGAEYCCSRLYLHRQNQIELLENQQQQLSAALCDYYSGAGDYVVTASLIKQVQQTQDSIEFTNWQIDIAENL